MTTALSVSRRLRPIHVCCIELLSVGVSSLGIVRFLSINGIEGTEILFMGPYKMGSKGSWMRSVLRRQLY